MVRRSSELQKFRACRSLPIAPPSKSVRLQVAVRETVHTMLLNFGSEGWRRKLFIAHFRVFLESRDRAFRLTRTRARAEVAGCALQNAAR